MAAVIREIEKRNSLFGSIACIIIMLPGRDLYNPIAFNTDSVRLAGQVGMLGKLNDN